jgi:DNA-binding response OmpR family regulator
MAQAVRLLLISNQRTPSPLQTLAFAHRRCELTVDSDPEHAVAHWTEKTPDIIVFDVDLPGARLVSLVTAMREEAVIPILLLTPDRTEEFALAAYEAGVDECILKPVNLALLEARIKVWCRRVWTIPLDILEPITINGMKLVPADRTFSLPGAAPIRLTHLELRLMYCLMAKPGRPLTFEELGVRMWGSIPEANRAMLKNVVYRLRQKIEPDPSRPALVCTVARVGYRFGI